METHEKYMQIALSEAREAARQGEIPIGAVVMAGGRTIARAHNLTETLGDVTAHAEMQALTAAASALGGKYLDKCTLYVTVEPCPMCAAALRWAQLGTLVYGARDTKRGYTTVSEELLHPKTAVVSGIAEEECSQLLSEFFAALRSAKD
ncbi:nucleoside deaminase [uncultured Rikenella sp.]|uniref:nucleoside deaminase n=1 Tax=uncultured Rikenella sp. TaxID=368003 RepID=UPI0026283BC5|nr:nucleoside deaminase [uncultured Rikenella sp.]